MLTMASIVGYPLIENSETLKKFFFRKFDLEVTTYPGRRKVAASSLLHKKSREFFFLFRESVLLVNPLGQLFYKFLIECAPNRLWLLWKITISIFHPYQFMLPKLLRFPKLNPNETLRHESSRSKSLADNKFWTPKCVGFERQTIKST